MPNDTTFESFEKELNRLVESFGKRLAELKQPGYAEAQLRDDFLNPFFRALGWDPMPNAASFEVQTTPDPVTGTWTNHPSVTKSKTSVSSFTSGAKVYSRVRAVNPAGTGAWSSEVAKIAP
jgi:hypothetical protein